MRLLNIITNGLAREGITNAFLGFYKLMDKSDLKIDLISNGKHRQEVIDEFLKCDCNVIKLPNRKKETLKYIRKLWIVFKSNNYDVVHVNGNSSTMAIELVMARIAGVKIRIAHSHSTSCTHKSINVLLKPLFYYSYNVALACGEDTGKWLFNKRPFIVIHNGKDFSKYIFSQEKRDDIRRLYGISDERVIGFVGGLYEWKNPEYLLNIFKEIFISDKNVRFFIIGDGAMFSYLKNMAIELGIQSQTVFTGRVSNVNEMIQAMDVMLLPSKWEGLPTVVIEWQAAGLPCIISDRITKECAVTDLVHFKSIDEPAKEWAKEALSISISERNSKSTICCQQLTKAGFNLKDDVKQLRDCYFI